jgi:hypothetical protein
MFALVQTLLVHQVHYPPLSGRNLRGARSVTFERGGAMDSERCGGRSPSSSSTDDGFHPTAQPKNERTWIHPVRINTQIQLVYGHSSGISRSQMSQVALVFLGLYVSVRTPQPSCARTPTPLSCQSARSVFVRLTRPDQPAREIQPVDVKKRHARTVYARYMCSARTHTRDKRRRGQAQTACVSANRGMPPTISCAP